MKRIDSYGATPTKKWTEGNPETGTPATVVSADYMNVLQEEIIHVIETAGVTLDQGNSYPEHETTQLREALDLLYLNRTGATMNGTIDMDGQAVENAGYVSIQSDPVLTSHAARKAYVDAADAQKLALSGGTMSGSLSMGGNTITNAASVSLQSDPVLSTQAARKSYVDARLQLYSVPVGSIVPFLGASFLNSANGTPEYNGPLFDGDMATLADNLITAGGVYRVCDGTLVNDAESPFNLRSNGSPAYLPNIGGGVFLRGWVGTGDTGGADSVTLAIANLPSHSHSINHDHASVTSSSAGSHNHGVYKDNGSTSGDSLKWTSGSSRGTTIPTDTEAAHAHDVNLPSISATSGTTGSGTAFSIIPKYMNVIYLMRVK